MVYYSAYYFLIAACLVLAITLMRKGHSTYWSLALLFGLTLTVELVAEVLIGLDIPFVWLYHLYSPAEYALITMFMSRGMAPEYLAKTSMMSTAIFAVISLCLSFFYYHFAGMPGINIGIESVLLFAQASIRLFGLHLIADKPVLRQEYFWISIGLLLFFGVCTFVLGIYTPLFKLQPASAVHLFGLVVKPFNLVLYICMSIGLWLVAFGNPAEGSKHR